MSSWKKNKMTRWPSLDYFMYLVGQIKNHEHLKGLLSKQISKISYFSLHDWSLLKPGSTHLENSFMKVSGVSLEKYMLICLFYLFIFKLSRMTVFTCWLCYSIYFFGACGSTCLDEHFSTAAS